MEVNYPSCCPSSDTSFIPLFKKDDFFTTYLYYEPMYYRWHLDSDSPDTYIMPSGLWLDRGGYWDSIGNPQDGSPEGLQMNLYGSRNIAYISIELYY